MIDWAKLKNEYINTSLSQRQLADKYKVSQYTLMNKAHKDEWAKQRKQRRIKIEEKTNQKAIERLSDKEISRIERINNASDCLLAKLEEATKELDNVMLRSHKRTKVSKQDKDKYVEEVVENEDISYRKGKVSKKDLKQLTSALKDIKEITANEVVGKVEVEKDPITRALEELANE